MDTRSLSSGERPELEKQIFGSHWHKDEVVHLGEVTRGGGLLIDM